MQSPQIVDYNSQIEEAARKAKCKKVLYLYDETGNREMLGVFSKNRAAEIRKFLQGKKLLNRLTEFDVKTTEPDSDFRY
jgi:hypothetical protein